MRFFIGDHKCKVDTKGRVVMPAAFRNKLAKEEVRFVLHPNIYEACIDVFPEDEWLKLISGTVSGMSMFDKQDSQFIREIHRGTEEVELDGHSRILIPRRMLEAIGADSQLVMVGQGTKLEIWDENKYAESKMEPEELVNLTAKIFGDQQRSH